MAEQPFAISIPLPGKPQAARPLPRPASVPWRLVPFMVVLLLVFLGPLFSDSPTSQNLTGRLTPPIGFGGRGLGTDGLGRDLWARLLAGARLSLWISTIAASGAAIVGIFLGSVAGMMSGWIDRVVTLLVETVLAVPFITVGLMVTATIGQSTGALLVLLIGTGWIVHARVLRAQVELVSRSEYVRSAQAMGASGWHIGIRHILPNLLPIAIVVFFQQIGSMLLWSASLTWLGIGMPIQKITLGGIVRDGQDLLYVGWWVSVAGGLAIVFIVTSLNLVADWIRIRLDPTLKGHS